MHACIYVIVYKDALRVYGDFFCETVLSLQTGVIVEFLVGKCSIFPRVCACWIENSAICV